MFNISTNLEGNLSGHKYFSKLSITDEALAELHKRREAGEKVSIPAQVTTLKAVIPVDATEIFAKLNADVINRLALAQLKIKMRAPGVDLVEEGADLDVIAKAINEADYSTEGRSSMSKEEKAVRETLKLSFPDEADYAEACVRASKAGWDKLFAKMSAKLV